MIHAPFGKPTPKTEPKPPKSFGSVLLRPVITDGCRERYVENKSNKYRTVGITNKFCQHKLSVKRTVEDAGPYNIHTAL